MNEYYKLMRKIKKSNRKYMNRIDILNLINVKEGTHFFRIYKKIKCSVKLD